MTALHDKPGWRNHRVSALTPRQARVFFNPVQRVFAGTAKNTEDGLFAEHVDGVIAPLAFGYLATIHAEQLVEFGAIERDGGLMASPAPAFVLHRLA